MSTPAIVPPLITPVIIITAIVSSITAITAVPFISAWRIYAEIYSVRLSNLRLGHDAVQQIYEERDRLKDLIPREESLALFDAVWQRMETLIAQT